MNKNISREWQEIPRLGLIPFNWCAVELGAIGEFKNGINKDKDDFGYGSKIVSLMDVFGKTEVRDFDYGLVNVSPKEIEAYGLIKGDILFVRSSVKPKGVGLTAVVVEDIPDTVFSGFIIRFRHNGSLDVNFSKHCFDEEGFRRRLLTKSTISANTNVNQQTLKRLILPLPPLAEQRRIAEILGAWDEAISLTQRLIAAKQQRKKGLMQQLLTGRMRLPGFVGEWREVQLGKFLKYSPRKVEKPAEPYSALGILSHGKGTFHKEVEEPDKVSMTHLFKVEPEDLIVNITFAWEGAIALVKPEDAGRLVSHRFPTYIFNRKKCEPHFFKYVMLSKRFFFQLGLISPGGAGRNRVLSKTDFLKLEVNLPPLNEQRAIAAVLQTADEEIGLWQRKLAALRRQKKGLMQKLLTGQVRVKTLP